MIKAIRYEVTRLASIRSTWVLLATAIALQAAVAFIYASKSDMTSREQFVYSFTGLSLVLVTLCTTAIGVNAMGHEYRYRTITTTVLTVRGRGKVLAAKALTTGVLAACSGVAMVGVTLLVQALVSSVPTETWRIAQVFAAVPVYTTLAALVGLGLAAVTRNATISMVAVIAFPTLVEIAGMFAGVSPKAMPFHAASELVTPQGANPALLALPLLTLAVGLLGAGGVLLARRDV